MARWNGRKATQTAPAPVQEKKPANAPAPVEAAVETPVSVATAPVAEARNTPESRLLKLTDQLTDAQSLKATLLRELNHGLDKEEQLTTVESEIADLTKRIGWLKEAQKLEQQNSTKEAIATRWKQTRDGLQIALDEARQVGKRAEAVIATMAGIGAELAEIEQTKARVLLRCSDAISQMPAGAGVERRVQAAHDKLRQSLAEITLAENLLRVMHEAGIGTRGIVLSRDHFSLTPFRGTSSEWGTSQPAEVIEKAADQLKRLMNETLMRLPGKPTAKAAA